MIEIDRNVPMPAKPHAGGRPSIYPWAELEIGDSFFVPDKKSSNCGAWMAGKLLGRKFSARTVDGGVRVWRIK